MSSTTGSFDGAESLSKDPGVGPRPSEMPRGKEGRRGTARLSEAPPEPPPARSARGDGSLSQPAEASRDTCSGSEGAEVNLSLDGTYRGPLDLLLHLVREEEVDVRDVAVARVCEAVLRALSATTGSRLEDGAEWLLAAATLLLLKSRMLLPGEEVDLEEELVPDDRLVESLLEYRRVRDAARVLEARAMERAARSGRGAFEDVEVDLEVDLGELNAFDLALAFSRLTRETLLDRPHLVSAPQRPLRLYAQELLARLDGGEGVGFLDLFEGRRRLADLVGSFAALLELVKQGLVRILQSETFGSIELALAVPPDQAAARFEEAFPAEPSPKAD